MRFGVLGAGTWGMALARMLNNAGHSVEVWSALEKEIENLDRTRRQVNLPYMVIPDEIVFTKNIEVACKSKDIIIFAVPSVFVRSTARSAAPFIDAGQIIVDVAKGIEPESFLTMSEIISSEIPTAQVVALSGKQAKFPK